MQLVKALNREKLLPEAIITFLSRIAHSEHPLVLFIDDLQWIDPASLKLLDSIFFSDAIKYLYLIGAYRNNEVDFAHPFVQLMERAIEQGISIEKLQIPPLQYDAVATFIAESTIREKAEVKELAELVIRKTDSNPFFIRQFLNNLCQRNLLRFDLNEKKWLWSEQQISMLNITDNVVELLIEHLGRLDPETRTLLHIASCIGNEFELETLAKICKQLLMKNT